MTKTRNALATNIANVFDVGIIGAGMAGSFATLKLALDHKKTKTIVFDIGRPPLKRRHQIVGWLGCLPNSDGKLYQNDINNVSQLTGLRRAKTAHTWFKNILKQIEGMNYSVTKDKKISNSMKKSLEKLDYNIFYNDYVQIYPKEIHALSKYMSQAIEDKNITFKFDQEVTKISKNKNVFVLTTADGEEYHCKKIIVGVGRNGWRWVTELYKSFGIIESNNVAKFGIRIEVNAGAMKNFKESNCSFIKQNGDLEIGPLSWYGTVIPEDHFDLAISSFRSNENRWNTDKVSFNLIGNRMFPEKGIEQIDRLGRLTFIIANDRIIKEKLTTLLAGKSKISVFHEYDWIKSAVQELIAIIPELGTKGYFHVPTIIPSAPSINIGSNLETEIPGMFVVGESAGINGLLAAACMGIIAADNVCK